ncbi:MAG: hypothetical protein JSS72_00885 [Armatimonadetes bacterium]|nr:hypothetical protein [Armatimonadota bacterium]
MKRLIYLALLAVTAQVALAQTVESHGHSMTVQSRPSKLQAGAPTVLLLSYSGDLATSRVTASLAMPSMASMMLDAPEVKVVDGKVRIAFDFPHPGKYELTVVITPAQGEAERYVFTLNPEGFMHEEASMKMRGTLGPWSMNRESSGTAWQPDAAPMMMKNLPPAGGFEIDAMGTFLAGYVNSGSKRGEQSLFSNSMFMLMARKDVGAGTLGFNFMTAADVLLDGPKGVPNLFQTGEELHGSPIVDRQHPHNIFSELSTSYTLPFGERWQGFIYGGPVGEPALGGPMFMHRASGSEVPEAPITHHWFDSTHISTGVITLGAVYDRKWKLEGSVFNGHEPGENRYPIGPVSLNSFSGRLSYNPNENWSFQGSYGVLNSPEATDPGVDVHRITLSAGYDKDLGQDHLSATAYMGQNIPTGGHRSTAWLGEATLYKGKESYFARFERVDKDELFGVPAGDYMINKLLLGDTHTVLRQDGLDYGLGAYVGLYQFPSALQPYYGKAPVTFGVFMRIRPVK